MFLDILGKTLRITSYTVSILFLGFVALSYFSGSGTCPIDEGEADVSPSDKFPEFEFAMIGSDEVITQNSIEGSYTLIYFWSTSCGICIREMPYLHDTYEKLSDKNFEILAVSADRNAERVERFMDEKYSMPWIHTIIGNDRDRLQKITSDFGISGTPFKMLVSPNGELLTTMTGFTGDDLTDKILSHMNESD